MRWIDHPLLWIDHPQWTETILEKLGSSSSRRALRFFFFCTPVVVLLELCMYSKSYLPTHNTHDQQCLSRLTMEAIHY